jgi:hypothetical protein
MDGDSGRHSMIVLDEAHERTVHTRTRSSSCSTTPARSGRPSS